MTTHLALLAKLCLHRCDECRRGPQPYLHQLALQHGQAPTRACWRHEATLAARHGRACPGNRSLQVVTRAKIKRGDVITQRRAGLAGRARRIDGAGGVRFVISAAVVSCYEPRREVLRLLRPEVGPHRYGEARTGDGRLASGQPRSATHDVVSFDGGPDAMAKQPADAAADAIDAGAPWPTCPCTRSDDDGPTPSSRWTF